MGDRREIRTGAEPGTYFLADTDRYQASPGRWSRLDGGLYIFTGRGYDGETSAASGSLRLDHLIDVIDLYTGEPIPVRQICAASGTIYPSSGADEPE